MTRLAITLGDPRGIGPEIVAHALAQPLEAEVTLVGAEDQIAGLPATRRVGVGTWGLGSGERAEDRARTIRAGRVAGHAVETAVKAVRVGDRPAILFSREDLTAGMLGTTVGGIIGSSARCASAP